MQSNTCLPRSNASRRVTIESGISLPFVPSVSTAYYVILVLIEWYQDKSRSVLYLVESQSFLGKDFAAQGKGEQRLSYWRHIVKRSFELRSMLILHRRHKHKRYLTGHVSINAARTTVGVLLPL